MVMDQTQGGEQSAERIGGGAEVSPIVHVKHLALS